MSLFSAAIWWLLDLTLVCVLYRGWKAKMLARYRYFYWYLLSVLCSEAIRAALWVKDPADYSLVWWVTEGVTAVAGFGVTWQIYTRILAPYEGVNRMARVVLSFLFFAVLVKAAIGFAEDFPGNTADLERDLRSLQALLLVAIIALMARYALPAGRNVRAMLLGYGLYIGTNLVAVSLRSVLGSSFEVWWRFLPEVEYSVTLIVWCAGMWSYSPDPVPDFALEMDYEHISAQTLRGLERLRSHLTQPWRT